MGEKDGEEKMKFSSYGSSGTAKSTRVARSSRLGGTSGLESREGSRLDTFGSLKLSSEKIVDGWKLAKVINRHLPGLRTQKCYTLARGSSDPRALDRVAEFKEEEKGKWEVPAELGEKRKRG